MELDKFLEMQFTTLREEIRETKTRIFYIAGMGLFVIPGGEYLSRSMGTPVVELVLPILVVCVGLLYLSENHALMRCGRYIRLHIEPKIEGLIGWERWLESEDACDPRVVDKYVSYSIYLLICVYYVGSSIGAYISSTKLGFFTMWFPFVLAGFYTALGVAFFWLLVTNFKSTTGTKEDTNLEHKIL